MATAKRRVTSKESHFSRVLRKHFSADPSRLPLVCEHFDLSDHMNVQLAIESYLEQPGRSATLLGVNASPYGPIGISNLVEPLTKNGPPPPTPGPVRYQRYAPPEREPISAVERGLYLVRSGEHAIALLIAGPGERGFPQKLNVEVMAKDAVVAQAFLSALREGMRKRNVYRGRVVSLSTNEYRAIEVNFHALPKVTRDEIILPGALLERIERQTLRFAAHSEQLSRMGQHRKRGLMLHGPPGTGKTFTAMYLASQMRDRTTFLVTGRGMGLIEQYCAMARLLQPAIVIVEDVDLIGEERSRNNNCNTPVLFELLNQMDGLGDDADILFLLTTNRPEAIEPALASRPGRIDQAIEIPAPDAECRRRLLALYGRKISLDVSALDPLIARTEGVSAAFMRELLRKAALFAVDEGASEKVEARHLDEAMHELVVDGGALTQSLLGGRAKS